MNRMQRIHLIILFPREAEVKEAAVCYSLGRAVIWRLHQPLKLHP